MDIAQAFLLDQIPQNKRALIPTTLKTAYAAAELFIANEPIAQVRSARANRGRIIQWAVDLGFQKLVESGQFGEGFRWRAFAKPTGQYLEVRFSHSALTISQVANPTIQPRDVVFRRMKRVSSQITMKDVLHEDEDTSGLPHILLLHGHQSLNFAHLAIPDPDHQHGYQHRSANLMLMPHAVAEPEIPMEDTDMEAVMTLKEEIERWRQDNGRE